jgi:2-succinyl-6-hydroxy-2,4-cyclohexadiene-1-carboxylate synthase
MAARPGAASGPRESETIELHADWDGPPPPGGRTLVLLHGFTGDAATWDPVREGLRRWGSTLALDLIGHGGSPAPAALEPYRMEACVAQVLAALERREIGRAWLVGYSLGGRVALSVAARHPKRVAGLILESASPGLADAAERAERVREDEALAADILAHGVPAFVARWSERPMFGDIQRLPPERQAAVRAQRLRNSAAGLAQSLRGMGSGAMEPLWERLAALDMPALLLAGEEDGKFVAIARQMQALLPQARLGVIPAARHTPHLTQPAEWLRQVSGFFESV